MRRRVPEVDERDLPPARLRRFDERDWPGWCHPPCGWWDAFDAWREANPDADESTSEAVMPDGAWHPEEV